MRAGETMWLFCKQQFDQPLAREFVVGRNARDDCREGSYPERGVGREGDVMLVRRPTGQAHVASGLPCNV